jgi:hypothetical protein
MTNEDSEALPHVPMPSAPFVPKKTPMYQAIHSDRYARQSLIKGIEAKTGRQLISYVSGIGTHIDRDDTVWFADLLHNVQTNRDLDLLLHTPGGDIDAAEKLITLVHTTANKGALRVIVPDFAKSAGTLMALGANKIVMSDTSELGPIDPQVVQDDGHGNRIPHPVQSYLDAYYDLVVKLRQNPNDVVSQIMLNKLDPATVKEFEAVKNRAQKFAEEQLKVYMLQTKQANYTEIAAKLMDTKRWLTHGQMISWQAAQDLGLEVEYLRPHDELWSQYWQLYCLQRLAIKDRQKLFESDYASLCVDGPA